MSRRLSSGQLDRQLTIRSRTIANDGAGQPIETWSDLATVWAAKNDTKGDEGFTGAERSAEIETTFTIRYRNDVTTLNRLTCEGRNYEIIAVREMDRRAGLQLDAKARSE